MKATITINNEKNGIEVAFTAKPETDVLTALKEAGFRWHRQKKVWYAKNTDERMTFVQGIGEVSSTAANGKDKKVNADLWEITRTDDIPYFYGENHEHSAKVIAMNVRKHLRARFPFCKWSVTSSRDSVDVSLLTSPFEKGSDELMAIAEYAYRYTQAYNYDNSDSMSDYFDVNFYGTCSAHSIVHWNYEQTEMTDEYAEMAEVFKAKKADFEKAEAERQEREYQERKKQYEIEKAEAEKRAEEEKRIIADIEASAVIVNDVDYTITNARLVCNKCSTFEDYYNEHETREDCKVAREVYMTAEQYEQFTHLFISDFSFLARMGGTNTDDRRITDMEDYTRMSKEERETVHFYCDKCVAIFAGNELKLVIDPQGFSYARYVYLVDEQTERVGDYHTDYVISEEEAAENRAAAEKVEEFISEIIRENNMIGTWDSEGMEKFREIFTDTIKERGIRFDVGVVRAMENLRLKYSLYRLLNEPIQIRRQFDRAGFTEGQKLTIFQISSFGMFTTTKVKFDHYEYATYAQYDNAVKMVMALPRKRGLYKTYFYNEVIIVDGWKDIPRELFFERIESVNGVICEKSRFTSCDKAHYEVVLDYFKSQGIEPLVNTFKPVF